MESLARQANLEVEFLRTSVYDEFVDMVFTVELVCTCGLPVAKAGEEGNFYCLHCDRGCPIGLQGCAQCGYAMLDREYEESEEVEEDPNDLEQ